MPDSGVKNASCLLSRKELKIQCIEVCKGRRTNIISSLNDIGPGLGIQLNVFKNFLTPHSGRYELQ